jgi:hypothetical protein
VIEDRLAATIVMTAERVLSFVDTNVLVYAFDGRCSPKKAVATRLMNEEGPQCTLRRPSRVAFSIKIRL